MNFEIFNKIYALLLKNYIYVLSFTILKIVIEKIYCELLKTLLRMFMYATHFLATLFFGDGYFEIRVFSLTLKEIDPKMRNKAHATLISTFFKCFATEFKIHKINFKFDDLKTFSC